MAAPVDEATARRVADAFRVQHNAYGMATPVAVDVKTQGFNALYVFSYSGEAEGFVIVAADDCATPVLAYSFTTAFDVEMNPAMREWLTFYNSTINAAVARGAVADEATHAEWERLLSGSRKARKDGDQVAALVPVTWGQGTYYNRFCPEDELSGRRAYAGCVATAMGQIMRYWNHPAAGVGSHCYVHDTYGRQCVDFRDARYDWPNMPVRLDGESNVAQVRAVATLLYHCGVAVDIDYGLSGSGSNTANYGNLSMPSAQNALPRYFDYKGSIASAFREDYSDADWAALLKSELDAGRPLIYSGFDTSAGGHAFICDGYDAANRFHFNWGWSGSCDGFYALSAVAPIDTNETEPSYNFIREQQIVYQIEPNDHLRVDTANITFLAEGGSFTLGITAATGSSQRWTLGDLPSWLTASAMTGEGSGAYTAVTLTSAENTTGASLAGTLRISQGGSTIYVSVHQIGCRQEEMCHLNVSMADTCGDSWNYAYLEFCDLSGATYGTASMISGPRADSTTVGICPEPLKIVWHKGVWDAECGFAVTCSEEAVLCSHTEGTEFTSTVLATINEPCRACGIRPNYELTVRSISDNLGSVSGGGTYPADSCVMIAAQANYGYRFLAWQDHNTDNPRLVCMDSSMSFTAYFALDSFSVVVRNLDTMQGNVWGTARYQYRDVATLRATAAHGYHFSQWNDGDTTNPRSVVVTCDTIFTASFAANNYHVELTPSDLQRGSVRGGGDYLYGATATIEATATTGYRFYRWSDGNYDNPRALLVTGNTDLTAEFILDGYHVAVRSNNGSEGSVEGDSVYEAGSTATIRAIAATGYHFVRWNDGNTSAIRDIQVTSDTSFIAFFFIDSYTIAVRSANPAQGSVQGSGSYDYSSVVTLTAVPATGYHFVRWDDGDTTNPRIFNATGSGNYTAYFAPNEYNVTLRVNDATMGVVSGAGDYLFGAEATIAATPDSGFRFMRWSNGATSNPYRFVVSCDTAFTAYFDSIPTVPPTPEAIVSVGSTPVEVFVQGSGLVVRGAEGMTLTVCDALGRVVYRGRMVVAEQRIALPYKGVFVVSIEGRFHSKQVVR